MKYKVSICIVSIAMVLIAAIAIGFTIGKKQNNEINENTESEMILVDTEIPTEIVKETETEEMVPTQKEIPDYKFIILKNKGVLSVYTADKELFLETDIFVDGLPQNVLDELEAGIKFGSEDELYSFLESYSS